MSLLLAHGGGGGPGLVLAFVPAGLILVAGLLLVFLPIVNDVTRRTCRSPDEDLLVEILGEEEAREYLRHERRTRALRRRAARAASGGSQGPPPASSQGSGDGPVGGEPRW